MVIKGNMIDSLLRTLRLINSVCAFKFIVFFYVVGNLFTELLQVRAYKYARYVALLRNPNVNVVGVTAK